MLHVHRAERADRLVERLADILRDGPADPFTAEVVSVPARGVERWLGQRLAHVLGASAGRADGVCANVLFPSPSALIAGAVAAAGGSLPEQDPWERRRLLWTLIDVLDECAGESWCPVGADGDAAGGGGRRLTTARHLAGLFDSYAAFRPSMLRRWAAGADTDGGEAPDQLSDALPADLHWQAELWRRVRARIGTPSPAERLAPACDALLDAPDLVDLPERLSLFGPTRLTTAQLEVLAALAGRRAVHLWLPHPSAAMWDAVAAVSTAVAAAARAGSGQIRRRSDPTVGLPGNPLLSSLARDARELQLRLGQCRVEVRHEHLPLPARPASLLGHLQDALAADVAGTPPGGRPVVAPDDRTLAVHACHGPARQVEVLREVVVGLLAADPTLEPRDVIVMCPDIEEYAPLLSASFGLDDTAGPDAAAGRDAAGLDDGQSGAAHPGHRLRVRLADRSLRQTNPLLATVAALLELADARVTASQVLDLAASAPVRRRFGFRDDDLERLQEWVAASGVRWGLDAAHRRPFGLAAVAQNTWRAGLDRVLLGAAMAEDEQRWVGLALPLDDVDSSDIDLAGRLAELLDRLTDVLDSLAGERPLSEWLRTLTCALDRLTSVAESDAWQPAEAARVLARLAADAGDRAGSTLLSLPDVHALLAHTVAGRPTRANFRTGNLTMCSMVPMRSVPHRVVCLLGMDDAKFPRSSGVDGDDVLARDPCVGERDVRSEDRQLLLDAVMAAREHLVILYTGADPRTNATRPSAVPVAEILDAVDAAVRTQDGRPAREQVVVRHPLQPFDARNFLGGELGTPGSFSFDRSALLGARRAAETAGVAGPFLAAPLPPAAGPVDLALEDLIRFLEQPVRGFLRQRLGLTIARDEAELADGLSIELTALEQWAVGDRLLKFRLAGADPQTCEQAEWRRGALPPGELGKRVVAAARGRVEPLVAESADVRRSPSRAVDVRVDAGGVRLTGTVGGIFGDVVLRVEYSKLAPRHRLRAWVQLLALSAALPATPWRAVTIGRGVTAGVRRSVLGPLDPAVARRHLAEIVRLHADGLRAPLPMAVKTSAAYADKRRTGTSVAKALDAAGRDWTSGTYDGEQADDAHQLVWGEAAALSVLLAEPPGPAESGEDWPADEITRFGALARRLWDPLLSAETQDSP